MPDGQQPRGEYDHHLANTPGPSSAPPVERAEGDPLDPATKAALDPNQPNFRQGESEPIER